MICIGFARDLNRRRDELTSDKNIKGKYQLRITLKDVFGFAERQEKAIYCLGYKLTLTRKKDDAILDKPAGIADATIKIDHISWYVSYYILSIQQQSFLSKQFLSKTATEFRYIEGSVFMKEVNNQSLWNFELGSQESIKVPIWFIFGLEQRDRQDSQSLNNSNFVVYLFLLLNA